MVIIYPLKSFMLLVNIGAFLIEIYACLLSQLVLLQVNDAYMYVCE